MFTFGKFRKIIPIEKNTKMKQKIVKVVVACIVAIVAILSITY
jgi:hypothetical protein